MIEWADDRTNVSTTTPDYTAFNSHGGGVPHTDGTQVLFRTTVPLVLSGGDTPG